MSKVLTLDNAKTKNCVFLLYCSHLFVPLQRNKRMTIMAKDDKNIIGFTVALISEFARHYGIRPRQAYAYLKRFKGLDHLQQYYEVLHTQSFPDTVEALSQVCSNNGGELR
jgi:hypothetical protein